MVTGLKHAIAFVLNRKIIINSNTPNLVAQRDPFCLVDIRSTEWRVHGKKNDC